MTTILFMALCAARSSQPSWSVPDVNGWPRMRQQFPGRYDAGEQIPLWREHERWLLRQRQDRGWEGGRWDGWLEDAIEAVDYWRLLAEWVDDEQKVHRQAIIDLIGADRFLAAWRPYQFPSPAPTMIAIPAPVFPNNPRP